MSDPASDDDERVARAAHWADYRKHIQTSEQKSQEDFDKTVLSLSGGALGISFVFLKDVIGPNPVELPVFLFAAWVCWGFSTFSVLASYYLSHLALRHTIQQIDNDTLHKEQAGGPYRKPLVYLNAVGAVLFLAGVCTITVFANANLKLKGQPNGNTRAGTTAAAASTPTSAAPASTSGK